MLKSGHGPASTLSTGDLKTNPVCSVLLVRTRGGPTRLKILRSLISARRTCNEIARLVGISWRVASEHIAKLRSAGLVDAIEIGKTLYYGTTDLGARAASITNV